MPPDAFTRRHSFGGRVNACSQGKTHVRRDDQTGLPIQGDFLSAAQSVAEFYAPTETRHL